MSPTALEGLRIVEYASLVAGPFCTKLLGDMGADVLKIERPDGGDPARRLGPFPKDIPDSESSGIFLYVNTNKRGVTIDIETASGHALFLGLIHDADVFVHDRSPAEARGLRIDYETLKVAHPRLIVTSVTPFGSSGPYADYQASELNISHAGGEGYTLPGGSAHDRAPEKPPVKLGGHATDYDAGLTAAVATMYAVLAREFQGVGQHVDVSRQECEVGLNRVLFATYFSEGKVVRRENRHYTYGGMFPTRDGEVVLRPAEDHHWRALARAMGKPDMGEDPRFRDRSARVENGKVLNALIGAWTAAHTKQEVDDACRKEGCPGGPCANVAEIMAAPQIGVRGFFQDLAHPRVGTLAYPTAPYQFSETPSTVRRPAPLLGQHNAEVLGDRLGLSPAHLSTLRANGVI